MLAQMARHQGTSTACLLKIADETVAYAVNVAASVALSLNDRDLAKLATMEAMAAMWGKEPEAEIEWEEVIE